MKHLPMRVDALAGDTAEAYVLDSTPPVLSVGLRCTKRGFSFLWINGYAPCLVTPDKTIVPLDVDGDIPYLKENGLSGTGKGPSEMAWLCGAYVDRGFLCLTESPRRRRRRNRAVPVELSLIHI